MVITREKGRPTGGGRERNSGVFIPGQREKAAAFHFGSRGEAFEGGGAVISGGGDVRRGAGKGVLSQRYGPRGKPEKLIAFERFFRKSDDTPCGGRKRGEDEQKTRMKRDFDFVRKKRRGIRRVEEGPLKGVPAEGKLVS